LLLLAEIQLIQPSKNKRKKRLLRCEKLVFLQQLLQQHQRQQRQFLLKAQRRLLATSPRQTLNGATMLACGTVSRVENIKSGTELLGLT